VQHVTTFICNTRICIPMKFLCKTLMDVLQDYITESMFYSIVSTEYFFLKSFLLETVALVPSVHGRYTRKNK